MQILVSQFAEVVYGLQICNNVIMKNADASHDDRKVQNVNEVKHSLLLTSIVSNLQ